MNAYQSKREIIVEIMQQLCQDSNLNVRYCFCLFIKKLMIIYFFLNILISTFIAES